MVATFYKIVAISDRYIETVTNLVGNDFLLSLIAMVFFTKIVGISDKYTKPYSI